MNAKRLLSCILAAVLCTSSFTAFAESKEIAAATSEEAVAVSEETVEIAASAEEKADDPTEEIVAMPDDGDDGSVDYSDVSNWAYWNDGEDKEADLFFVCPTVDMGEAGNFIADIGAEKYRRYLIGATCQELGIYSDVSSVYAPFYRQATFPVYSLPEQERAVYLDIAYEDVREAFLYYAENSNPSRPLILAGFSQGADHVIRLIKEFFDEPRYQRRLVAAYAIGWKLTEQEVKEYPHAVPAEGETDTGVIVAFNSEAPENTSSIIVGENEKSYCINPLNWKTSSEPADKTLNKGACFTNYSGEIKQEIPALTGAYIDEKRGVLKTPDIVKEDYSSSMFEDGIYHLYDYQFFFRNLQENVKARLSAYNEKYADRIDVYFNDEIMCFDVEPIIESGRTLVPFRAIFEVMGCAVNYTEAVGKQIVSARRGNNTLSLTIGEDKMYFNGEEKALDVPARIVDGRTLIPLRAVFEAFECEVFWDGDTRRIEIYNTSEYHFVTAAKLSESVKDEAGNTLIEAVVYYPVIHNYDEQPYIDEINEDYRWYAERLLEEARGKKEDALLMRTEMGEAFVPFVYEQTYEQTYNYMGDLSFTTYKYVNLGGAHPSTVMESRSFATELCEELALVNVINEDYLRTSRELSLMSYVAGLIEEKLKEIDPDSADEYTSDFVRENIGEVQFYLAKKSVVIYFNRGTIMPYALGVISVEIPYDPELILVDMSHNCLDEYTFELEYDKGYEWQVALYSDERLELISESTDYHPEALLSEGSPVGITKITARGKSKGNTGVIFAHVNKDNVEDITKVIIASIYVDGDNRITVISEYDGMFLLN